VSRRTKQHQDGNGAKSLHLKSLRAGETSRGQRFQM
jgi:hypothetical protein